MPDSRPHPEKNKTVGDYLILMVVMALALAGCPQEQPAVCHGQECQTPGNPCPEGSACDEHLLTELQGWNARVAFELLGDGRRVLVGWKSETLAVLIEEENGTWSTHSVADAAAPQPLGSGRLVATSIGGNPEAVHIAYATDDASGLLYASVSPQGEVHHESIPDAVENGNARHISIAASDAGQPHIAFRDESQRVLKHAVRNADNTWEISPIDGCATEADCPDLSNEDFGEYTSIVLVGNEPRISFYDRFRGDLKLAVRNSNESWEVSTVDGRDAQTGIDTADVGRFARMEVDHSLRLAIAYADTTNRALKYYFPSGANPEPFFIDIGSTEYPMAGVLRRHAVGSHVDLAFDEQGRAHLIYLDSTAPALKHAVVAGTSTTDVETVDSLPPGILVQIAWREALGLHGFYGAWNDADSLDTRLRDFLITSHLEGSP